MNTLKCVLPDDDVGKGSTILKNENGAVAAGVGVAVAPSATVELPVAQVLAATDPAWGWERDNGSRTRWDVKSLSRCDASDEGDDCDFGDHVDGLEEGNRKGCKVDVKVSSKSR